MPVAPDVEKALTICIVLPRTTSASAEELCLVGRQLFDYPVAGVLLDDALYLVIRVSWRDDESMGLFVDRSVLTDGEQQLSGAARTPASAYEHELLLISRLPGGRP